MARPHPHPRARGRFAARRAGAGRCRPAARRQLERRRCRRFTRGNMAEAARRFEMVADAAPDQASSWTLSAGSFWAARANLLAGNPQKFAPYLKRAALHGRTFYGLIAQKALGMRIEPDWNVPALDRTRADMLRNDRVGRRALALLQLGAATAAERELFAASIDADPQYHRGHPGARPEGRRCPACRSRVGNANWDQRHNIKGFDGAIYPLPPWQPAGGYLGRPRAGLGLHAPGIRRSIPRRAPMSAPWA